ncbi:MAG: hypothetical protein IJJ69_04035 [Oscillospiraceae bacterium]|nr:hypothetical protein [Oscillospiraceae bacterium]
MKLYHTLEKLECLQGDTLPVFRVAVSGIDDLSGTSMLLILEQNSRIILQKTCTLDSEQQFCVQLTSGETAGLIGEYLLHFRLTGTDGLIYRKITGTLTVTQITQGG